MIIRTRHITGGSLYYLVKYGNENEYDSWKNEYDSWTCFIDRATDFGHDVFLAADWARKYLIKWNGAGTYSEPEIIDIDHDRKLGENACTNDG